MRAPPGVLLLLLLAVAADARPDDMIQLAGGEMVAGRVLSLGGAVIKYEDPAGKTASLAAHEVAGVTLDDAPAAARQGDQSLAGRDHDRAIASYQAALADIAARKCRELNRQFIRMQLASAWRARGRPEEALRELKKLREECGDCWLRADSFAAGIEIARQQKDEVALRVILDEMKTEEEPIRGRAELERAKLELASNAAAAQKTFERLGARGDGPYAAEARLWNIRALRALRAVAELEQAARAETGKGSAATPALLQAAHATLAARLLEAAGADADRLREALLESQRAVSLGPPAKQDSAEDHALGLLAAARASAALARVDTRPEAAAVRRALAAGYWREVLEAYPRTEWARAAQAEMAETRITEETSTRE